MIAQAWRIDLEVFHIQFIEEIRVHSGTVKLLHIRGVITEDKLRFSDA